MAGCANHRRVLDSSDRRLAVNRCKNNFFGFHAPPTFGFLRRFTNPWATRPCARTDNRAHNRSRPQALPHFPNHKRKRSQAGGRIAGNTRAVNAYSQTAGYFRTIALTALRQTACRLSVLAVRRSQRPPRLRVLFSYQSFWPFGNSLCPSCLLGKRAPVLLITHDSFVHWQDLMKSIG